VARDRQADKINAEDITIAAGEYDTSTREEFKRDPYSEEKDLSMKYFNTCAQFCLEK